MPGWKTVKWIFIQGNSTEGGDQFRVAAAYDSQPFYLVTNIGNQEVLDGLNMALEKITDANPSFGAERYAAITRTECLPAFS